MTRPDLNVRQARFVAEYLVDACGKQAAIRAGYSPRTAEGQASELLRLPKVRDALKAQLQKRLDKTGLRAERLDQELARIAFVDMGAAFGPDGDLLPIGEIPEDTRRALAGVEVEQHLVGGEEASVVLTKKVKLLDKTAAIALAYKRLGLLTDRLEERALERDAQAEQLAGLQQLLGALVQASPSGQLVVPCAACAAFAGELELVSDGTTVTLRIKRPAPSAGGPT